MYNRKFISVIISSSLILGTFSPAYAAEIIEDKSTASTTSSAVTVPVIATKISKETAKQIGEKTIKNYFNLTIDDSFHGSIQYHKGYQTNSQKYVWDMNWYTDNSTKNINAHASIDAQTGKILSMGKHESKGAGSPSIVTITRDEAKKIADDFVKKLNPSQYDQVKINEDSNINYSYPSANYSFTFKRIANGIKFDNNSISVTIDGIKGNVTDYTFNWDDNAVFPGSKPSIDIDKAQELFKNQILITPRYINCRDKYSDYSSAPTIKFVYGTNLYDTNFIDATSGQAINYNGKIKKAEKTDMTDAEKQAWLKSAKPIPKLSRELDAAAAQSLMDAAIKSLYGDGYEIKSVSYSENQDKLKTINKKAWNGNFQKKDSSDKYIDGGEISLDPATGTIIRIENYGPFSTSASDKAKPVLTWQQAYKKALDAAANYFPDKIQYVITSQTNNSSSKMPREYNFQFIRTVNGILYNQNYISVAFNAYTGQISRIYSSWNDDLKFPSTDGAITKDAAQTIFFNNFKPDLVYESTNKSEDVKKPDYKIVLAYKLNPPSKVDSINIDAFTGNLLDYSGQEINTYMAAFQAKVKGTSVEKQALILASQGIIDTKDFDIKKQITRDDLLKVLVNAKGYRPSLVASGSALSFSNIKSDDSNYKYLQLAVMYGILENTSGEYKGTETISREDLAVSLVKLLGYDKLATSSDIFSLKDSDSDKISPVKYGYVAIAKGLNLLSSDKDNKLNPQDTVTMQDLIISVYNVLGNLRN